MKKHDLAYSTRFLANSANRQKIRPGFLRFTLLFALALLIIPNKILQAQDFLMCSSKRFQVFALPRLVQVDPLALIESGCSGANSLGCKPGSKSQKLEVSTSNVNLDFKNSEMPRASDSIEVWNVFVSSVYYDLVGDDPHSLLGITPKIEVIASPAANAITLKTGKIVITTGLLSLLDSKSEVAFVLGHELGHLKHGISHGRKMAAENEADQFSVTILSDSGYDPAAAKEVLRKLALVDKVTSAANSSPLAPYLSSRLNSLEDKIIVAQADLL